MATKTKKPKIYIANPLGFAESTNFFYKKKLIPLVEKAGFDVLDPWALTPQEVVKRASGLDYGPERRDIWRYVNGVIGKNNEEAIKKADAVLAVLDGTDVDSGTAAELGYATGLGKIVIGYRGDFRLSSDNEGSIVNLQVEYFIKKNGGDIFTDLKTLEKILISLAKELSK